MRKGFPNVQNLSSQLQLRISKYQVTTFTFKIFQVLIDAAILQFSFDTHTGRVFPSSDLLPSLRRRCDRPLCIRRKDSRNDFLNDFLLDIVLSPTPVTSILKCTKIVSPSRSSYSLIFNLLTVCKCVIQSKLKLL